MRPPSRAEWPLCDVSPGEGFRDISNKWTPRKVVANPVRREMELAGSSVLNPWKRITEAMIVAVENPT